MRLPLPLPLLLALAVQAASPAPAERGSWSEPSYLAEPGPGWSYSSWGKLPWLTEDLNGQAFLAFLVPVEGRLDLRGRFYQHGSGWAKEQTLQAALASQPGLFPTWAAGQGPAITWCDSNHPTLGHTHPLLLWAQGRWRHEPELAAPVGTYSTSYAFPVGTPTRLEHHVLEPARSGSDRGRTRILRQELTPGAPKQTLFQFGAAPGEACEQIWNRPHGPDWCAALVPSGSPDQARVVVQRRDRNGHRSAWRPLGLARGYQASLASAACDEGYAVLAWTSESDQGSILRARIRTPNGWQAPVRLGKIAITDPNLQKLLMIAGPDHQGRLGLAWIDQGRLQTRNFSPNQGWDGGRRMATEVAGVTWAVSPNGRRILLWQVEGRADQFLEQAWAPESGWGPVQSVAMPAGSLPQAIAFDDGSALAVGLAGPLPGADLVRPWSMERR